MLLIFSLSLSFLANESQSKWRVFVTIIIQKRSKRFCRLGCQALLLYGIQKNSYTGELTLFRHKQSVTLLPVISDNVILCVKLQRHTALSYFFHFMVGGNQCSGAALLPTVLECQLDCFWQWIIQNIIICKIIKCTVAI